MKNIKYILIAVLMFAGMVSLFPRGVKAGDPSSNTDAGVASVDSTHNQESSATERNQQSLIKAQPLPSPLNFSMERKNLIDKLKFEAKQGAVGYVALIGPQGQLVAYYTVQGKVSSLNSYLTTSQQSQWQYAGNTGIAGVTFDSPDLDGSYGVNPSGVFFFTTSGRYVEWSGNYLFSDQPTSYVQQPLLVETQK